MTNISMNVLESEAQAIVAFYNKQIRAYQYIKKEATKLPWSDAQYDAFVDSMNTVGSALSGILQTLTDGNRVYLISELSCLAEEYMETAKDFPQLTR